MKKDNLKHRDINWLYFNERVLFEAKSTDTPLLERLKFLAIFSSNLDEYFKVRVAQLRQIKHLDKKFRKKLMFKANSTLQHILKTINEQKVEFGKAIKATISELEEHNIYVRNTSNFTNEQKQFLESLFDESIKEFCSVHKENLELTDGALYLAVTHSDHKYSIVEIPTENQDRFIVLPGDGHQFCYLDDAIRLNIQKLLPNKEIDACYSIKLSRDAELYLEDDYSDIELVEKIYNSLDKRLSGQATRLLYDETMPSWLIDALKSDFKLGSVDLSPGGAYHNLSDFFSFPLPKGTEHLQYHEKPALPHPELSYTKNIFESISKKDQLVHFPYQDFKVVEEFLTTAATDPQVSAIKMTIYRIAKSSSLADAILTALDNNKKVTLFVEAQARFDEANNIKWGRIFEEKGAKVIFSIPQVKVHSKIAMVYRNEEDKVKRYAYIGTGNFNAKTSKIYCDHGLFTADKKITKDLGQVFQVLERKIIVPKLKSLLVSPFTTRITFLNLIQNEINAAREGRKAAITAKMNSLEDSDMIRALYRAVNAGVDVRLIIRGFCCYLTANDDPSKGMKDNIYITNIVDRYLEHGRIYHFENGGDELMYIGSADWMTRNLDRRIEVLTPIIDPDIFDELKHILTLQLNDNQKARVLDLENSNKKVAQAPGQENIRSQYAIYNYLKNKLDENR
ncbi:polyphosphate kinase 1 [Maribacter sp. 1_MG-2023]|uniref:polyphosphate kinase 1 n=1 Tax=Maribacter sp. 1_MG-2023 TaxID=3062677 RepID=UPI0026E1E5AA|nr:polyphosphate kinase 1 [Maribacter sp. 1_MG-2023]MDO6472126.1 polyphosphate kinase 1 [Maribacter sp. 1_MG-2023]